MKGITLRKKNHKNKNIETHNGKDNNNERQEHDIAKLWQEKKSKARTRTK